MSRNGKLTKGIEEAHPFAGMSRINPNAAGVDIGAVEDLGCVSGTKRISGKNSSHGMYGSVLDPVV